MKKGVKVSFAAFTAAGFIAPFASAYLLLPHVFASASLILALSETSRTVMHLYVWLICGMGSLWTFVCWLFARPIRRYLEADIENSGYGLLYTKADFRRTFLVPITGAGNMYNLVFLGGVLAWRTVLFGYASIYASILITFLFAAVLTFIHFHRKMMQAFRN